MNTIVRLEDLIEGDFRPYKSKKTAVRLLINGIWYAGILTRCTLERNLCYLGLNPHGRFGRDRPPRPPDDPGPALISTIDRPIIDSFEESGQPFRLIEPQRIIWTSDLEDLLGIRFKAGVAILSQRKDDMFGVDNMLDATRRTSRMPSRV